MEENLAIRGTGAGLAQLAIVAALLILPAGLVAGQWGWSRGWGFVAIYGVIQQAGILFLARYAPHGLTARLRPPAGAGQPLADRIATALVILSLAGFLVFVPIDVLVWRIFDPVSWPVALAGLAVFLAGYGLIIWTIHANKFAIPVVEDQTGAGQYVVDTGPYAIIRHPMYLGILMICAGVGLWLGSLASLLLLPTLYFSLVFRIQIEEQVLTETLPDYVAYRRRVRFRVLPLIW